MSHHGSNDPAHPTTELSSARPSRRTLLAGAAWTAPVIAVATAAPAYAVSLLPSITVLSTSSEDCLPGVGNVIVRLNPDPPTDPQAVATYDDLNTSTRGFTRAGTQGPAGLFRLQFATTSQPVPATITATIAVPGYGTATATVTMEAAGNLDLTYADALLTNGGATTGHAVLIQPDGKILVAGTFTSASAATRRRLARFNSDGTLDTSFADPNLNDHCYALALQPDGKILAAGKFTQVGGVARGRLARINSDGTLDTTFSDPQLNGDGYAIALQTDGKVVVGGHFTAADTTGRKYVARFDADGTLDTGFIDPDLDAFCFGAALQGDGKVVVCGDFASIGGVPRTRVARLQSDGTLDTTFVDPVLGGTPSPFPPAPVARTFGVAVQPDGKILATGEFSTVGGVARAHLARLTPTGALDTSFPNPLLDARGRSVTLQPDGKILVTGDFANIAGVNFRRLARFTSAGVQDVCFADPSMTGPCLDAAVQSDGKIVVTGGFSQAGAGTPARAGVARFHG